MCREESTEAGEFARQWSEKVRELYDSVILAKADPGLIKEGIGMDNAAGIVSLCMDGYRLRCSEKTPRETMEGFLPYLAVLKKAMT
jgi:hypothetical protein